MEQLFASTGASCAQFCSRWLVASGWWLVAGGWWLVAGGWWLGRSQDIGLFAVTESQCIEDEHDDEDEDDSKFRAPLMRSAGGT